MCHCTYLNSVHVMFRQLVDGFCAFLVSNLSPPHPFLLLLDTPSRVLVVYPPRPKHTETSSSVSVSTPAIGNVPWLSQTHTFIEQFSNCTPLS